MGKQVSVVCFVKRTESKRVHQCNRPGSHGKNIPQDATNPSRSPLKRLNRCWVIVTLNFENDCPPITNVNNSCSFPRALKYLGAFCWKQLQQRLRVFVATVLRPHDGEDASFCIVWLAAQ